MTRKVYHEGILSCEVNILSRREEAGWEYFNLQVIRDLKGMGLFKEGQVFEAGRKLGEGSSAICWFFSDG